MDALQRKRSAEKYWVEVLWSLFFLFFIPHHFSAVIFCHFFSMYSQQFWYVVDFFFNLRREKKERKRNLNYCHCSSMSQNWDLGISLKDILNISVRWGWRVGPGARHSQCLSIFVCIESDHFMSVKSTPSKTISHKSKVLFAVVSRLLQEDYLFCNTNRAECFLALGTVNFLLLLWGTSARII